VFVIARFTLIAGHSQLPTSRVDDNRLLLRRRPNKNGYIIITEASITIYGQNVIGKERVFGQNQ